jgi:hypothetical protein
MRRIKSNPNALQPEKSSLSASDPRENSLTLHREHFAPVLHNSFPGREGANHYVREAAQKQMFMGVPSLGMLAL